MVHGLDISHWQSVTPPLGAQDFVFCRATYGAFRDGKYAQHAANVRRAGLVLGAYHFGRSGSVNSIESQVAMFLAVSAGADLLVLDLENDAGHVDMTRTEGADFIAAVKRARPGVPVGLYASQSSFPLALGQTFNWVAKWSPYPPTVTWAFWQYTSDGSLPGYTGRLDFNRFNGSLAELRELAGEQQQGDESMALGNFYPMGGGDGLVTLKPDRGLVGFDGNPINPDDREKLSHCRVHFDQPYRDGEGWQDGYLVRHSNKAYVAFDAVVASFSASTAAPKSVSYALTIDGKPVASGTTSV